MFDSWAGALSLADYRRYVLPHSARVFGTLADRGVAMTHFGVGTAELLGAMAEAGATVIGVDWRTSLADATARVETGTALQGNLDPAVLLAGWPAVEQAARAVVEDGRTRRGRRRGRAHFQPRARGAAGNRSRRSHRTGGAGSLAMTHSYCVVGGGISGLTAAYRLRAALGDEASITLFDPADRLGGVLRTEQVGGVPIDVGAEAFVVRRPEMPALLDELGLANRQVGTTGARPLIYSQDRLHPLPPATLNGIPSSAESMAGLVNDATLAHIASEPSRPFRWQSGGDPAVADLVADRFGEQVVARSVDPMLGGVYAGSAATIGVRSAAPTLAAALDGGAAHLTEAVRQALTSVTAGPVFGAVGGGYAVLVDELVRRSRLNWVQAAVAGIEAAETPAHGWMLRDDAGAHWHADAVILAVPARAAGRARRGVRAAHRRGSRAASPARRRWWWRWPCPAASSFRRIPACW